MRIVNKRKFIKSVSISVFILLGLLNICIAKTEPKTQITTYTVSQGETLWNIAKTFKDKKTDTRQYIYEIKKLNNMEDSTIYEGQTLKIYKTNQ